MDRLAQILRAAAAVAFILAANGASAEGPAATGAPSPPDGKGGYRLGEVRIVGSVEHPEILFFLPRARFRLLPPRVGEDWGKRLLREDVPKGDLP